MHSFWRILLRACELALVVGMCLWMLLDPSSGQNRRKLLNEIRAKGGLPALSVAEAQALEAEFNAIGKQVGTRETIRINAPLANGYLSVWITSSSKYLRELTGTNYGNAVYDATLDAIFIDRSLVDPDDLLSVYSHSSYASVASFNGAPYLRTLLQFIFAHELAHREHDRVSAGAFDAGRLWGWLPWCKTIARNREIEADRYAFEALMRVYSRAEKIDADLFPFRSAPIYDIPIEEIADRRQAGFAGARIRFPDSDYRTVLHRNSLWRLSRGRRAPKHLQPDGPFAPELGEDPSRQRFPAGSQGVKGSRRAIVTATKRPCCRGHYPMADRHGWRVARRAANRWR
jgi:hypothetical protein